MKYYINTIIFDNVSCQSVEGAIVIDLYVANEEEANANIFACDVAHLPIIRQGIAEYEKVYGVQGEWKQYTTPLYNNQFDVKCIYQENNNDTFEKIKKFGITIQYESDSNHCPLTTQFLTCCNDYTAYEIAWHRHQLGKSPILPLHGQPRVDDLFMIVYPQVPYTIDMAKVVGINKESIRVAVNDNQTCIVDINSTNYSQFQDILLMDDLLIKIFGFTCTNYSICGNNHVECLVKDINVSGVQTKIILQKVVDGYIFSSDNDALVVGKIHITYLSELQHLTKHSLFVNVNTLQVYLRDCLLQYHLVTNLRREFCEIWSQKQGVTRNQIINKLSKSYNVSQGRIESVLKKLYI